MRCGWLVPPLRCAKTRNSANGNFSTSVEGTEPIDPQGHTLPPSNQPFFQIPRTRTNTSTMSLPLHPPPTKEELEFLSFLSSDNWQVRQVALSNLAGYSTQGHPRRGLLLLTAKERGGEGDGQDVLEDVRRLSMDLTVSIRNDVRATQRRCSSSSPVVPPSTSQPTAHSSFSLLINLCSSPILARKISTPSFLSFLVGYISHPTSILADLASMLLSNLTKFDDQTSRQLIEMRTSVAGEEVGGLELLLAAFDQGASVSAGKAGEALEEMKRKVGEAGRAGKDVREVEKEAGDGERKSTCHFLASVFANVSAVSSSNRQRVDQARPSTSRG